MIRSIDSRAKIKPLTDRGKEEYTPTIVDLLHYNNNSLYETTFSRI